MRPLPRHLSVLLLDEDGHHSQKVAVCLGQIKDLKLHVISNRRWVPIRFSRHVDSFRFHRPGASDAEQLETVLQTIRQTRSEVLFPVVDANSRFVVSHQAVLARYIALTPVPPASSLRLGLDKNLFCDFLMNHNIPQPPTIVLRSLSQAKVEAPTLAFPVLFKPAVSGGGAGIKSFADPASLLCFLRTTWRAKSPALLQSYVRGQDVDSSVLCKDGKILAHTIQTSCLPRRHPFGFDDGLEFIHDPQTLCLIASCIQALNWSGIAHFDLRRDQQTNEVQLLDFNPRYWTSLLGSLAAGVNFPYLSCLAALGIEFEPPTPALRRFFTAEATVKHLARKWLGRSSPTVTVRESGLAFALGDPGPRAFYLAKRCAAGLQGLSNRFSSARRDQNDPNRSAVTCS